MAVENQVLIGGIGVYVGFLLHNFFEALIRDVLLPLLSPLATSEGNSSKMVIQLGGLKINVGNVLVAVVDMVIGFTLISFLLPYLRDYVPIAGRR